MQYIQVEQHGHVLTVTLNRPQIHNAFDPVMIAELKEIFLNLPSNIRACILKGEGKSFSAGADLRWMRSMAEAGVQENKTDALRLYDMFAAIRFCPVPVIARIQGAALGGGTGLAAVCDMVFCHASAQFGFTEVRLGIMPSVISPFVLEKVGAMQARRWFLTGERFSAQEAKQMGLVHEVVEEIEDLDHLVHQTVQGILKSSPSAVRKCKRLIDEISHKSIRDVRSLVAEGIAAIRVSEEGQEGLHAFLNKKLPDWDKFCP